MQRINRPNLRWISFVLLLILMLLFISTSATAQIRHINRRGPNGTITLPYQSADGHGNTWMVYPGILQMQGTFPVYQQAGAINISGTPPQVNGAMQGKIDDKTGELIIENLPCGNFTLTRHLQFNTDEGYVRIIDVIKNPQGQDQPLNLQVMSYINFGVQSSQMVADPKKNSQNIAWVATTAGGNPKAAVDVYAGAGCKNPPTIEAQPGGNSVTASLVTTVPANKEIAFAHFHMVSTNQDQGIAWVSNMKVAKLFADVPKEIRSELVNFRAASGLLGDLDLLRGDVLDVVELRSGDRFNGNLTETSYKLDTFYGVIELPVDKVVSIINAGQFRPRQLVVTSDGQIFGGHLEKPTIELELTSGQKTQIPIAQINRIGYRHRTDEKQDAIDADLMQAPYVLMSSGDRVSVNLPKDPVTVVTRYGTLQLSPDVISSIIFNSDDSGVHTIELTDGSRFNGLATATEFDFKLATGGKDQDVKFPTGGLNRIVYNVRPDTKDDSAPSLQLKKDDLLIGTLTSDLKLDTAFDTIAVHAAELRGLNHSKESPTDMSITTWDGTIFSGQLQEQIVQVHLKCGVDIQVPIGLLDSYSNPGAAAPEMILNRIKSLVGDLNADDWKQRDAAEQQLIKIGPGVVATLKQMRDQQPPEAQQRIDSILKQLKK